MGIPETPNNTLNLQSCVDVDQEPESLRRSLRKKGMEPELKGIFSSPTKSNKSSAARRELYKYSEAEHANEADGESPNVIINKCKLTNLFHYVLSKTRNYSVDDLLKLHTAYSQILYRHRMNLDRSKLLEVLFQYHY